MFKPLNRGLYLALQDTFGRVEVTNPGIPNQVVYWPDWEHRQGRLKAVVNSYGETYRVDCPFCSDRRRRLYINHHWGVKDARTGDDLLNLARCFNEGCLATREAQKQLEDYVFPGGEHNRITIAKKPPKAIVSAAAPVVQMALPPTVPLADLPVDHPAIRYLHSREFDPATLAKRWKVAFCKANPEAPPPAPNVRPHFWRPRIVYPVFTPSTSIQVGRKAPKPGLRLAGWQARAIDDATPKYLTSAGMKKGEVLYGLPQARKTEGPLVVVEGVTDVWRLDTNAVALFGKTISSAQCGLIQRYFSDRPVAVLLDQDAAEGAQKVRDAIRAARQMANGTEPVVIASLPAGRKDPGECSHAEVWRAVRQALRQR